MILLASRNAGKLREFRELLPGVDLVLWPAGAPEIPEDGAFFQDNALQKATFAKAWWDRHGSVPVEGVLADDSGLCVDALWGGPGVLSARFAANLDPDAKNRRLLALVVAPIRRGQSGTVETVPVLARGPQTIRPTSPGRLRGHLAPRWAATSRHTACSISPLAARWVQTTCQPGSRLARACSAEWGCGNSLG